MWALSIRGPGRGRPGSRSVEETPVRGVEDWDFVGQLNGHPHLARKDPVLSSHPPQSSGCGAPRRASLGWVGSGTALCSAEAPGFPQRHRPAKSPAPPDRPTPACGLGNRTSKGYTTLEIAGHPAAWAQAARWGRWGKWGKCGNRASSTRVPFGAPELHAEKLRRAPTPRARPRSAPPLYLRSARLGTGRAAGASAAGRTPHAAPSRQAKTAPPPGTRV